MAAVELADIHKNYGKVPALRGVDVDVHEGEVFGLLGPNGAGKTSLIRILVDIIRADSGTVRLFGEPLSRALLDRVGYLPEERGLYRKQRVDDVLIYFARLKGLGAAYARKQAEAWVTRVGLGEAWSWRIERLSKGMGQKLQIAATLISAPDLCILDEPFSGLDPVNVALVKELIRERRDLGLTTILSTHRMTEVETLCDRVGLIHRGRRVVYGPIEEVREKYSHPEAVVRVAGPMPKVDGASECTQRSDGSYHLRLAEDARPEQVLRALVEQGATVLHFERHLVPLEQIFIEVVAEEEP